MTKFYHDRRSFVALLLAASFLLNGCVISDLYNSEGPDYNPDADTSIVATRDKHSVINKYA
jgi:hypothetical protein